MSVESPAAAALADPLAFAALPPSDGTVEAVRARRAALFDPALPLPADVTWAGDHILNPDWGLPSAVPKPAAVLFLLGADTSGEPSVLFIERAGHLSSHAGQIGLPGGKVEPGEVPAITALREAQEEVGLPAGFVEPLGFTAPYATRTGYLVTPLVGILKQPLVLMPDPGEVAGAFLAPFHHVMDAERTTEILVHINGRERRTLELMWGNKRIWGVTAGILRVLQQRLIEA